MHHVRREDSYYVPLGGRGGAAAASRVRTRNI